MSQDDLNEELSQKSNASLEYNEEEITPKKGKEFSADNPVAREVEGFCASPVLVNNDNIIPCATNREEGVRDDTLAVSSPNAAGTNDTSRNTTDMPIVTEKENETFDIAWGDIETN